MEAKHLDRASSVLLESICDELLQPGAEFSVHSCQVCEIGTYWQRAPAEAEDLH